MEETAVLEGQTSIEDVLAELGEPWDADRPTLF
ncbi:hypothetical protein ACVWWH_003680 [Sinomonas sp. RB5]